MGRKIANRKYVFYLIIVIGICMVGYSSWQIIQSKANIHQTLDEARKIIETEEEEKERFTPKQGETVGLLKIPQIEAELAIIEGTDPEDLDKGVGHFKGSYYPNENGQIVLSGHRDTVFRRLGELEQGDELNIELPYGEFTYQITNTKIVEADDRSIITLQNAMEELVVTTCYPFRYIGDAPQRYIIYAERLMDSEV